MTENEITDMSSSDAAGFRRQYIPGSYEQRMAMWNVKEYPTRPNYFNTGAKKSSTKSFGTNCMKVNKTMPLESIYRLHKRSSKLAYTM